MPPHNPLNSRTGDAMMSALQPPKKSPADRLKEYIHERVMALANGRVDSSPVILRNTFAQWRLTAGYDEMDCAIAIIRALSEALEASQTAFLQHMENEAAPRYYDSACRDCTLCGGLGVDSSGGGSCRKCGGNGKGSR